MDDIKYEEFEVERLIKFLKASRNRTMFLSVSQFATSKDQGDVEEGSVRGHPVSGNVKVSCPIAVRFLENAYYGRARNECTIRVGISNGCIFIGRSC